MCSIAGYARNDMQSASSHTLCFNNIYWISDIAMQISKFANSNFRSREDAAKDTFSKSGKVGGCFLEYWQFLETWGKNSGDVIPSFGGGGVAVPDWPSTVHLSRISCTTFGEFRPLRAPPGHGSSSLFSRMKVSKQAHKRPLDCMDGDQWEDKSGASQSLRIGTLLDISSTHTY